MSRDGLNASDYVFSEDGLPAWVPAFLRRVLLDLTYWEFHAMELGLLGLFAGAGVRLGLTEWVAFGTAFLVGTSFGFRRLDPDRIPSFEGDGVLRALVHLVAGTAENIASRTLGREPWYFLVVYVLTTTAAWISYPVLA
jgi:hypothetical protein